MVGGVAVGFVVVLAFVVVVVVGGTVLAYEWHAAEFVRNPVGLVDGRFGIQ